MPSRSIWGRAIRCRVIRYAVTVVACAVVLTACARPDNAKDTAWPTPTVDSAGSTVEDGDDSATGQFDRSVVPTNATAPLETTELRPRPIGAVADPVEPSAPIRVRVPAVGIDAPLVELGLGVDGAVEAPVRAADAGWYTGASQPGQLGPAIIAAHVDSATTAAAFYDLRRIQAGDEVVVDRVDGSSIVFVVTSLEQHPKPDVPVEALYGPVPGVELRLITCSGDFDRSIGHYEDNLVVRAVLA